MDTILETRGLTKSFHGYTAVRDVDLAIERGSVHALIGPNGAGKTTLFNLLSGFLLPTSGAIALNGKDITGMRPAKVAQLGVVRSFQISAVFASMTALENVRVALQRSLGTSYNFWRSDRSLRVLHGRAMDLLDAVGLADLADHRLGELPYGHKRAIEIATTLALDPELLLLDEPTAGMSEQGALQVTDLIRRIAADRTIVLVEHNLKVVADLSHRITVLQGGSILTEGSYAEIAADPRVTKAYLGEDDDD